MFALRATLLLGVYAASRSSSRAEPEWPPHPDRLYQALVAAAYGREPGRLGAGSGAALRWLERQPPPAIWASEAAERKALGVFVPVNDWKPGQGERPRQRRHQPAVVPLEDSVVFIWREAEPEERIAETLCELAAEVPYLGASRSPVRIGLDQEPPSPNYVPLEVPSGRALSLRVPHQGRLAELDDAHAGGQRRWGARVLYGPPAPKREPPRPASFEGLWVMRVGGARLPIAATLTVTETLRRHLLGAAGNEAPEVLHGRGRRPHCAYLALADVDHPHADGHLLGIAVALPRCTGPGESLSPSERERLRVLLAGLGSMNVPGAGAIGLSAPTEAHLPLGLRAETWCGPARRWRSATPVVLDRHPKPREPLSEVIAKSCSYAGLPAPKNVQEIAGTPMRGVPAASTFRSTRRGSNGVRSLRGRALHLELEFCDPVAAGGPLLLGAGRHFGLGLFRPLDGGDGPSTA